MSVVVESVRQAPTGFDAKCVGLVTYVWKPSEFEPVITLTRYVKPRDGETQGKRYPVAKFSRPQAIRIIDAQIYKGDRGEFVTSGDLEIPREVLQEVCQIAMRKMRGVIAENIAASESGAMPNNDDIPF